MSKLIKNLDDGVLVTLERLVPGDHDDDGRPIVCVLDHRLLGHDEDRFTIATTIGGRRHPDGSGPSRIILTRHETERDALLDKIEMFGGWDGGQRMALTLLVSAASFDSGFLAPRLASLRKRFAPIQLVLILDAVPGHLAGAAIEQWLREQTIALAAAGVADPLSVERRFMDAVSPSGSVGTAPFATSIGQVLRSSFKSSSHVGKEIVVARADLAPARDGNVAVPFLSILTRTHGKRFHTLKDVFCCVSAQECTDFEHLIVAHNLDKTAQAQLVELIEAQIPEYRARIRVVPVRGGNRTRPLNTGFEAARGHYVAILDDDDIVFANWIEAFREQALATPGRMLRAASVRQEFEEVTINGLRSSRAVSGMKDEYGRRYEHMRQLVGNLTPPVSVAFPRYVFADFDQRFDESLTTTEDWDYIVRCVSLVGVGSIKDITSIYRWWNTAYSSRTDHTQLEWDQNEARILSRFCEHPYIHASDTIAEIRSRHQELANHELWAFQLNDQNSQLIREVNELRCSLAETEGLKVYAEDRLLQITLPWKDGIADGKPSLLQRIGKPSAKRADHMKLRAELVAQSGLFDPNWYRQTYLDVANEGVDPLTHFVQHGSRELRSPGPNFNGRHYYLIYDDVREYRMEPLFHYIHYGRLEGRKPTP